MPEFFCFRIKWIFGVLFFSIWISCTNDEGNSALKEGMSAEEVKSVVGEPNEIMELGPVYNADKDQNLKVVKWVYPQRTIVLIDDTVKAVDLKRQSQN